MRQEVLGGGRFEWERVAENDGGAWLKGVQEEFRRCEVSEDTHAFLHGLPTTVPGSWVEGHAQCGNPRCEALTEKCRKRSRQDAASRNMYIQKKECKVCAEERRRRILVAESKDDARFAEDALETTPIIVIIRCLVHFEKFDIPQGEPFTSIR